MTKKPPRTPRRLPLKITVRYQGDEILVTPHPIGEPHALVGATLDLYLISTRDHKIKFHQTIPPSGPAPLPTVAFPARQAPDGTCIIAADITDRHGHCFAADVQLDTASPTDAKLQPWTGVNLDVPAPWTSLQTKRRKGHLHISCWGREHTFDANTFLRTVRSRDTELLAAPIQLSAQIDGQAATWKQGTLSALSTFADQTAFLTRALTDQGLRLKARTEVDFDGMVRVDWQLDTTRPLRLDALQVDIALPRAVAKYFYFQPGEHDSILAKNAGVLRRNLALDFKYYAWLGNEDVGFSWFSDSDASWVTAPGKKNIEIKKRGDQVVLRLNLVSAPVQLEPTNEKENTATAIGAVRRNPNANGVLSYSFGFQATPIKPVEQDAWDYRMFCIAQHSEGLKPRLAVDTAFLDQLADRGVRSVTIFEMWADAESYVATPHKRALKKIVRDCHQRGLDVLLYFGFLISDLAPEWRDLGKDSLVLPKSGYDIFNYTPQPLQAAWRVCLNSPWQDVLADGMAKVLQEFDADGVYLDGTEYVWPCCNTEHTCGILREDGAIAPSFPIFAVRAAMRRIYHNVRCRRPDGQVFVHNSSIMTMPTLEWATTAWDGEQFQGVGAGTDVNELLPLDSFRAEFMGRQWGVATEFLLAGQAYTYQEVCGIALLHDVPVKPLYLDQLELMSALWKVTDDFDRKAAQWHPYWNNADKVKSGPRGVYTSLYHHPQNGVLLVTANVQRQQIKAKIQLNLQELDLPEEAVALDTLSGENLACSKGQITCELSGFGWKLIWIT